jgi:YVTN family beta-propeller protein
MNYEDGAAIAEEQDETIYIINHHSNLFAVKPEDERDGGKSYTKNGPYTGAAINADGKIYATKKHVLKKNVVQVLQMTDRGMKKMASIKVEKSPGGVATNPRRNEVYVTHRGKRHIISIIDTDNDKLVPATIDVKFPSAGVAVTPDGEKIYVTHPENKRISVINATTRKLTKAIPVDSPMKIVTNPDSARKEAYVTNYNNSTLSVIDTFRDQVMVEIPVGKFPQGVAVTADGKLIYVANSGENSVSVIPVGAWLRNWNLRDWYLEFLSPWINGQTLIEEIDEFDSDPDNPENGPREVTLNRDGSNLYISTYHHITVIDTRNTQKRTTWRIKYSNWLMAKMKMKDSLSLCRDTKTKGQEEEQSRETGWMEKDFEKMRLIGKMGEIGQKYVAAPVKWMKLRFRLRNKKKK